MRSTNKAEIGTIRSKYTVKKRNVTVKSGYELAEICYYFYYQVLVVMILFWNV